MLQKDQDSRIFILKELRKSESDDLKTKTGLIKGRVITENMKQIAEENIKKYLF